MAIISEMKKIRKGIEKQCLISEKYNRIMKSAEKRNIGEENGPIMK